MSVVLPSKRAAKTERMFIRTPLEAVGDTDIQNRVTITVGQNVHEIILMLHQ
jgi:hypothetical protein